MCTRIVAVNSKNTYYFGSVRKLASHPLSSRNATEQKAMVVYCPAVNPGKSNDTACPYNATTGGYTCTAPYDAVLGTLSGGCFTAEEIARSVNLSNLQQRAIVLAALSAGVAVGMRMNIQAVSMKNWKPAAIALFGQIICNPIIMIILTLVFGLSKESKMISLIIGTSPGGIGSNIATFLVGGSLAISAICTLAGSLIAIGSFPAWNIAATRIANLEGSAFKVSDLVLSIVAVAAPLFIGVAINYCFGLGDVYGINKINDEIGNSKDKPIVAAECLKTGGGEGGDENITTCGKIVKNIPYVLMGIAILSVIVIIGLCKSVSKLHCTSWMQKLMHRLDADQFYRLYRPSQGVLHSDSRHEHRVDRRHGAELRWARHRLRPCISIRPPSRIPSYHRLRDWIAEYCYRGRCLDLCGTARAGKVHHLHRRILHDAVFYQHRCCHPLGFHLPARRGPG